MNAGDSFRVFEAPDFNNSNDGRRFKRINPDYSIDFDDEGRKKLHTRDVGLSGVYLDSDLGLYSRNDYLAYSDDYGRVVLVSEANQKFSAEGAARENLSMRLNELKVERDRQVEEAIAVVEKKYGKAMKLMKG